METVDGADAHGGGDTRAPARPIGTVDTVRTADVAEFSRLVSERFAPLTLGCDRPPRFRGTLRGRRLGTVDAFDVTATQHTVERADDAASRTPRGSYMVHIQRSGVGTIRQGGREAVLHPGDLAFYDSDRAYSLSLDDRFHHTILVFKHDRLDLPTERVAEFTATRIPGDHPLAGLAAPFFAGLTATLDTLPAHSSLRVAQTVIGLVSTVLHGEFGSGAAGPSEPLRRENLLEAIYAYIDDHLAEPRLGPQQVAAAHYVSVRTLHNLFRSESLSVSEWIRARRLELCRAALADPLHSGESIGSIAAQHGFTQPAHFSRLFRATYGCTPSDARPAVAE